MSPVEQTTLHGAVTALVSSIMLPLYFNRKKDAKARSAAAAQSEGTILGAQQSFVAVLQAENAKQRGEMEELRREIEKLRDEIEKLRAELAKERRAREASEARVAAESSTRAQLISDRSDQRAAGAGQVTDALDADDAAAEVTIREAGDAAESQVRREQHGRR